jgi:membrane associated rhomboid family serine protease
MNPVSDRYARPVPSLLAFDSLRGASATRLPIADADEASPPSSVSSLAPFARSAAALRLPATAGPVLTFSSTPTLPSSPLAAAEPPLSLSAFVRSAPIPTQSAVQTAMDVRTPLMRGIQSSSSDASASLVPPQHARLLPARRVLWTPAVVLVDLLLMIVVSVKGGEFAPLAQNPAVGPPFSAFVALGAVDVPLALLHNQGWRLLTAMWLHAGILHLVVSAAVKIVLGVLLERRLGAWRVAALYLVCGVSGSVASALFLPEKTVVSGSAPAFGLAAALLSELCLFGAAARPVRPLRFGVGVTLSLLPLVVAGVLPLIDNFAHLFALLVGFATATTAHALGPLAGLLKRRRAVVLGVSGVLVSGAALVSALTVFFAVRQVDEWCGVCHSVSCVAPSGTDWRCQTSATSQ